MQTAQRTRQAHIAVFGRLHVGKSSLIHALAGNGAAHASSVPGTNVEPVYVPADILPLGRSVFIDTPGFQEGGKLGERVLDIIDRVLDQTDVAILVLDATVPEISSVEYRLLTTLAQREIPVVTVVSKADAVDKAALESRLNSSLYPSLAVSVTDNSGIAELRLLLKEMKPDIGQETVVSDLVNAGDIVMMVVPSDYEAPRGQLHVFHSHVLRETLDAGCLPMVVRESELPLAITALTRPPALVIVESTNFERIMRLVPPDIPLTSLSLLAARQKGNLSEFVAAVRAVARLRPGDSVLIAEGCSHRPLFEEAAHARLPMLLRTLAGGPLHIHSAKGNAFPDSLRGYHLVVHCGACMLNRRDMLRRQAIGKRDGVPVINYGVLSTYMNHALPRVLAPLRQNGALGPEFDSLIETANAASERRGDSRARALHTGKVDALEAHG